RARSRADAAAAGVVDGARASVVAWCAVRLGRGGAGAASHITDARIVAGVDGRADHRAAGLTTPAQAGVAGRAAVSVAAGAAVRLGRVPASTGSRVARPRVVAGVD